MHRTILGNHAAGWWLSQIGISFEIGGQKWTQRDACVAQRLRHHDSDQILWLGAEEQACRPAESIPGIARLDTGIGVELSDADERSLLGPNGGGNKSLFKKPTAIVVFVDEMDVGGRGQIVANPFRRSEREVRFPIVGVFEIAIVKV